MVSTKPSKISGPDRFEVLRRAQLASKALDDGVQIPAEAKLPSQGGTPLAVAAKTGTNSQDTSQRTPGLIYSRPGRPAAIVTSVSRQPSAALDLPPMVSPFERLMLGQQRLGRIASQPNDDIKALGQNVFTEMERESRLSQVYAMMDVVSRYYKASAQEIDLEKQRIKSLDKPAFDAITSAYSFAHDNVMIMTDEAYAQQKVRESERGMREFYEAHGSTAMQVEQDMADSAQPVAKKGKRTARR